jgi:hypothetical protein
MTRTQVPVARGFACLLLMTALGCEPTGAPAPAGPAIGTAATALSGPVFVAFFKPEATYQTHGFPISLDLFPATDPVNGPFYMVSYGFESSLPLAAPVFGIIPGPTPAPPTYEIFWTPPTTIKHNGPLTLTAMVMSADGSRSEGRKTVQWIVPQKVFLSPDLENATVSGSVHLVANGDPAEINYGGFPTHFEIFDGSTLIGTTNATFAQAFFDWDTTSVATGPHVLKTRGYDIANNMTESAPLHVTVVRDSAPPTVTLTAPVSGAAVTGVVPITATAMDDSSVKTVDFYDNFQKLGTATGPYVFNWDTASIPDGSHVLKAIATDITGKATTSASVNVTVDHTSPTLVVSFNQATTAPISALLQISGSPTDGSGMASVTAFVDGTTLAVLTAPPYTFSWETRTGANGAHAVKVVARDRAGNTTTSITNIVVDNGPIVLPQISIAAPTEGGFVKGVVAVSLEASSVDGIDRVELLDGDASVGTALAAPFSIEWDTNSLPEEARVLTARAIDRFGRIGTSMPVHVTIARTLPALTMTLTPAPPAILGGAVQISVTATAAIGIAGVTAFIDDVSLGSLIAAPYVFSWITNTVANGDHVIKVVALDRAGNSAESSTSATVYNRPITLPSVSLSAPSEGAFVKGTIDVSADATDVDGIAQVELLDGDNVWTTIPSPPFNGAWDTTGLTEGEHTLTARATDQMGTVATSLPIHVSVDRTFPTLQAAISPGPINALAGTVQISALASDDRQLGGVTFFRDGVLLGALTSPPFAVLWDTAASSDGPHAINVLASDRAGNVTSQIIATVVSNAVPVTLDNISNGQVVGKTVVLKAHSADDALVTNLSFFDNGALIGSTVISPFQITWNPATSGSHSLVAKATARGRVNSSAAVAVIADIDAPVVALTAPAPDAVVVGLVHLTATATDNRVVKRVDFFDGNKLIGSEFAAPYTESWNTVGLPVGIHTLIARAADDLGNSRDSAPVTVTVLSKPDTIAPKIAIVAPMAGAVAGSNLTWSAQASDNVGVTRIDYYDGAILVKSVAGASSSFVWNTATVAAGSHKLTARAFDGSGNAATSPSVTITVDHTLPSVTLTSPSNGAKVSGTVTLAATASDNIGIARVEFSVGGTIRCSDASIPYTCPWTVPAGSGKSYDLQAQAFDSAGNARSSAVVKVTAK